jgi:ferredoxin like protein
MINIENLAQMTGFNRDEQPHIILNKEVCRTCSRHECVQACPAQCFSFNTASNRLDVAYENCLECGTCYVICDKKAIDWTYPRGGFGVQYRMT